ncbi:putative Pumilio family RNA binding repeat [Trypanosoma vivax]|uniref:PUF1 (Regulator of mrna stability) n=1 Tax=Trypanosoma vivax (strain Y486) TaxID=1055687 RepID=G0U689_TRYVY|nr:pumilio RNA-binding protein [Trypanosoma vivax]KAH8611570.1 putative Pumilio family RNA binding repeat [Trypanosoma vivax]CCC51392.1 PUF1 [Trypanosoma vivax Y486]
MPTDEERLTELYTRRQNLLKQLNDVNNELRRLEYQINEKTNHPEARMCTVEQQSVEEGSNAERCRLLLDNCMRDANGLREAVRMVDALKLEKDGVTSSEAAEQLRLFRNTFVHEMVARAYELFTDPNGSELLQHMLQILKCGGARAPALYDINYNVESDSQLSEILLLLTKVKDHMSYICFDTNGSRVMQRILDCRVSLAEVELCAQCLSGSIIELCTDINGSHTVARLFMAVRSSNYCHEGAVMDEDAAKHLERVHNILYEKFPENCVEVCKNRQGCCIIQKCLLWAPEPYFSTLMDTILTNTLQLVHDPFGNYVVQFILDHDQTLSQRTGGGSESPIYTNRIIRQMLHSVAALSCDKFCSNVIEKCLRNASPDVRQLLVDELTDPVVLPTLIVDSFANYVIQTAIVTSTEEKQFAQLRDSITPLQSMLKNSPHGVKVEAKLVRRQREISRKQNNQRQQNNRALPHAHTHGKNFTENILGASVVSAMPAIPTLVGSDELGGHAVAFPGIPKDAPPVMASAPYMPLMLQGQQALIGLPPGYSQQIQLNMKGNGIWDHQQTFTLLQPQGSKSDLRR